MSHLKSQINREPIRVMQRERFCARKEFAPNLFGLLNRVIKKLRTSGKGAQETFFLRISNTRNARIVFAQLRIRLLHQLKRSREQFRENRLLNTEQTHRAHRTSHKTTQNIASALVRGSDAVPNKHQSRTHVIRHNTEAHIIIWVRTVFTACELLSAMYNTHELINFVHVVDALQQVGNALQAHTGVNVALLERTDNVELGLRLNI